MQNANYWHAKIENTIRLISSCTCWPICPTLPNIDSAIMQKNPMTVKHFRKVDTAVLATSSMVSTPRYRGRLGSSRGGSSDHHRGAGAGSMGMGLGGQSSQHRIFGSQEEYGAIHLGRMQASAIRYSDRSVNLIQ